MTRRKNTTQEKIIPKAPAICPDFDEAIDLFIKEQR